MLLKKLRYHLVICSLIRKTKKEAAFVFNFQSAFSWAFKNDIWPKNKYLSYSGLAQI